MQLDITEAEVRLEVRQSLTELYDSIKPYYNATTSDGIKLTAAWWEAETGIPARSIVDAMRRRGDAGEKRRTAASRAHKDSQAVTRALRNRPEAVVRAVNELPEAERKAIRAQIRETFEPTQRALEAMKTPFIPDVLNEAAELIRNASDLTEEDIAEIRAALDNATLAFTELLWKVEAQS